jgi:hypothetical protein
MCSSTIAKDLTLIIKEKKEKKEDPWGPALMWFLFCFLIFLSKTKITETI